MNKIRKQLIEKIEGTKFSSPYFKCIVAEEGRPMLLDFGDNDQYWIMSDESVQKGEDPYFMPNSDKDKALTEEQVSELSSKIDNAFERHNSSSVRRNLLAASAAGRDQQLIMDSFLNSCLNQEEKAMVLIHAANKGNLSLLQFFLDNGVEVNTKGLQNRSALHIACLKGNKEMVDLLLSRKSNINDCDEDGESPLHLAVKMKHKEICEILCRHGADPSIENSKAENPLMLSERLKFSEISDILRHHKTHVELPFHSVVAVLGGAPIISDPASQQDSLLRLSALPRTSPAASSSSQLSHSSQELRRTSRSQN